MALECGEMGPEKPEAQFTKVSQQRLMAQTRKQGHFPARQRNLSSTRANQARCQTFGRHAAKARREPVPPPLGRRAEAPLSGSGLPFCCGPSPPAVRPLLKAGPRSAVANQSHADASLSVPTWTGLRALTRNREKGDRAAGAARRHPRSRWRKGPRAAQHPGSGQQPHLQLPTPLNRSNVDVKHFTAARHSSSTSVSSSFHPSLRRMTCNHSCTKNTRRLFAPFCVPDQLGRSWERLAVYHPRRTAIAGMWRPGHQLATIYVSRCAGLLVARPTWRRVARPEPY